MHDVKSYIVYIPSRSQVSDAYLKYQAEFCKTKEPHSLMSDEYQRHARIIKYYCNHIGIEFIDLTPEFKETEKQRRLYWNYDEHLNSAGYELAAKTIFQHWKEEN